MEEGLDSRRSDPPQTRQRKRDLVDDKDELGGADIKDDDDDGEEEEVTRCICGHQEYPGLPVPPADTAHRRSAKAGSRDPKDTTSSAIASDILPEDAGGLFIQCDTCKVWQHGGCVGIMDEAMSPEEYFCEQCRQDLHAVSSSANG